MKNRNKEYIKTTKDEKSETKMKEWEARRMRDFRVMTRKGSDL